MRSRALRLNKERLAPLDAATLPKVVGGAATVGNLCPMIDWGHTFAPDCWNDLSFEWCPEPITLPIEQCI